MSPLDVAELRRLQYAANMLGLREFCAALDWEQDDYARAKFKEFQALGRLSVFDDNTLTKAVSAYESARA